MSRLTKRIDLPDGTYTYEFNKKQMDEEPTDENKCKKLLFKLGEYEDLEEQGSLVLFPRDAYFIKDNQVHKGWVEKISHSVATKPLLDIRYDDTSLAIFRGYLGNEVFLTEESAYAAVLNGNIIKNNDENIYRIMEEFLEEIKEGENL